MPRVASAIPRVRTSRTLFTADTHFGDPGILQYRRQFKTVEAMDRELIRRWNEVVGPRDVVHHVGDFASVPHHRYLRHLNGEKHITPGNHDGFYDIISSQWKSMTPLRTIRVGDRLVTLCHYAMRTWPDSNRGGLHFYGHSHGGLRGDSRCCDVGVDCWDLRPVGMDEISLFLRAQPDRDFTK